MATEVQTVLVIARDAGVDEFSIAAMRDAGVLVLLADDPAKVSVLTFAPAVASLPADGYWQGMAKAALGDDLAGLQRQIAADALKAGGTAAWESAQSSTIARARKLMAELAEHRHPDLAILSVALRELRSLA